MKRVITIPLILVLPMILTAKKPKVYKKATMVCSAFNDMKHRNNSNNIQLKVGKSYRVLQENRGQILTLIEGERIAQRWVNQECFAENSEAEKKEFTSSFAKRLAQNNKAPTTSSQSHSKKAKQNLLALSWQNAFCQTHQYKKECKNRNSQSFGAFEFVLHGLWPQPRNNQYCNVSKKEVGMDKNKQWYRLNKLDLNMTTRNELKQYMPGYSSNLHRHEWVKHGTCYGSSSNDYFTDAIALVKQVNQSKVQQYFKQNIGSVVTLKEVRKEFDKAFGKGAGKQVTMNCRGGLVTELWLHLGSGSNELKALLKSNNTIQSRCQKGRVDAVGF